MEKLKEKYLESAKNKYEFLIGQQGYGKTFYTITKLLMKLEFNVSSVGFQYWVVALINYKKNYYKYNNTIEKVYFDIAEECHTTRDRVERAMRTACEPAKNNISNAFEYNKKLTNKAILKLLTHNVCIIK